MDSGTPDMNPPPPSDIPPPAPPDETVQTPENAAVDNSTLSGALPFFPDEEDAMDQDDPGPISQPPPPAAPAPTQPEQYSPEFVAQLREEFAAELQRALAQQAAAMQEGMADAMTRVSEAERVAEEAVESRNTEVASWSARANDLTTRVKALKRDIEDGQRKLKDTEKGRADAERQNQQTRAELEGALVVNNDQAITIASAQRRIATLEAERNLRESGGSRSWADEPVEDDRSLSDLERDARDKVRKHLSKDKGRTYANTVKDNSSRRSPPPPPSSSSSSAKKDDPSSTANSGYSGDKRKRDDSPTTTEPTRRGDNSPNQWHRVGTDYSRFRVETEYDGWTVLDAHYRHNLSATERLHLVLDIFGNGGDTRRLSAGHQYLLQHAQLALNSNIIPPRPSVGPSEKRPRTQSTASTSTHRGNHPFDSYIPPRGGFWMQQSDYARTRFGGNMNRDNRDNRNNRNNRNSRNPSTSNSSTPLTSPHVLDSPEDWGGFWVESGQPFPSGVALNIDGSPDLSHIADHLFVHRIAPRSEDYDESRAGRN